MTSVVVDASALVAFLLDRGAESDWVADRLSGSALTAPSLLGFETENVIRRRLLGGRLSPAAATLARSDLLCLHVDLWPHAALSARAWEHRENLTIYDASYVAAAELTEAPLITLDRRLAGAAGLRCEVLTP